MSFILDALKKSDRKRQDGSVPELRTVHAERLPQGRRRVWWWLLGLVLLGNVAVLLWLIRPGTPSAVDRPEVAVQTPATQAPMTAPPAPAAAADPPASLPATWAAAMGAAATAAEPAPDNRVLAMNELPAPLRSRLPSLQMSVHAFHPDNPAASLVRINGQLLRVGARLEGGLQLDAISAEGAVLRSEGIRFLLPRRSS